MTNIISILKQLNNSSESLEDITLTFKDFISVNNLDINPVYETQEYLLNIFLKEKQIAKTLSTDIQSMVKSNGLLPINLLKHTINVLPNIKGTKVTLDFTGGHLKVNLDIKETQLFDILDHINFLQVYLKVISYSLDNPYVGLTIHISKLIKNITLDYDKIIKDLKVTKLHLSIPKSNIQYDSICSLGLIKEHINVDIISNNYCLPISWLLMDLILFKLKIKYNLIGGLNDNDTIKSINSKDLSSLNKDDIRNFSSKLTDKPICNLLSDLYSFDFDLINYKYPSDLCLKDIIALEHSKCIESLPLSLWTEFINDISGKFYY